jgi:hypothetical protein
MSEEVDFGDLLRRAGALTALARPQAEPRLLCF